MKKLFITLGLLLLPLTTFGAGLNLSQGGLGTTTVPTGWVMFGKDAMRIQATSSLFIAPTGNVGIGTTSPATALDVNGVLTVGTGSGVTRTGTLALGDGTFTKAYGGYWTFTGGVKGTGGNQFDSINIIAGSPPDGGNAWINVPSKSLTGTNGYGLLVAAPTGATNNYAASFSGTTIINNGNVGIGTTGPVAPLTIDAANSNAQIRIRDLAATRYRFDWYLNSSHQGNIIGYDDTGGVYLPVILQGNPIVFSPNGTERVRIDSNGNVGIGTTSPSGRLNVDATSGNILNLTNNGASRFTVDSSGNVGAYGNFTMNGGYGSSMYSLTLSRSNGGPGYPDLYSTGNGLVLAGTSVSGGTIRFETNGTTTPTMYLNNNGNVGIGTTSPSKLFVVGKISSTPTIRLTANNNDLGGSAVDSNVEMELNADVTGSGYDYLSKIVGTYSPTYTGRGEMAFYTSYSGIYNTTPNLYLNYLGNVGIGTTTPFAKLAITGTSGSTAPIFSVASSTNEVQFAIGKSGHIMTGGTTPTVSSCGTSPTVIGDDNTFRVRVGSGSVSTCLVTFANTWVTTNGVSVSPSCQAQENDVATPVGINASSTPTNVTFAHRTGSMAGELFDVDCKASNNFTY